MAGAASMWMRQRRWGGEGQERDMLQQPTNAAIAVRMVIPTRHAASPALKDAGGDVLAVPRRRQSKDMDATDRHGRALVVLCWP